MLNFVKGAFRGLVEILFWVILIGCAGVGGWIGDKGDHLFLGVIIGLGIGILVDIIYGGIVAVFLAIEENTAHTNANTIEIIGILRDISGKIGSSNASAWGRSAVNNTGANVANVELDEEIENFEIANNKGAL